MRHNGLEPEPRCFSVVPGCSGMHRANSVVTECRGMHSANSVIAECSDMHNTKDTYPLLKPRLWRSCSMQYGWSLPRAPWVRYIFDVFIHLPSVCRIFHLPHIRSLSPTWGHTQHLESWALGHRNCQRSSWDPISLSSYPLWFCFLNYAQILIRWKKRLRSTVLCTRYFLITLPELLLLIPT